MRAEPILKPNTILTELSTAAAMVDVLKHMLQRANETGIPLKEAQNAYHYISLFFDALINQYLESKKQKRDVESEVK